MVSLRQSNKIYDAIRKIWVESTPEEQVRQKWIQVMIQHLSYPSSLIAVEKTLEEAATKIRECPFPNRRVDLLCYANDQQSSFYPLLLMEFKADSLQEGAFEQIIRYNTYVGAKYLAVANESEVVTGFYSSIKKRYYFVSRLPLYQELKDDLVF